MPGRKRKEEDTQKNYEILERKKKLDVSIAYIQRTYPAPLQCYIPSR